jgi:hypothetical protein
LQFGREFESKSRLGRHIQVMSYDEKDQGVSVSFLKVIGQGICCPSMGVYGSTRVHTREGSRPSGIFPTCRIYHRTSRHENVCVGAGGPLLLCLLYETPTCDVRKAKGMAIVSSLEIVTSISTL